MIKLKKLLKEFNKSHFLNLIKKEIDSLKGQIAYSKDKVRYKGTPDWEKKEFKGVLKDLLKKLKDTEKHYKRVQKLKEGFGGVTSWLYASGNTGSASALTEEWTVPEALKTLASTNA